MKYSIIIPTYNNFEGLKKCLLSIEKYTDFSNAELIIVANGCSIETIDFLNNFSNSHSHVKVLFYENNIGYPKAINFGIKLSIGEYIILLNDDTELLEQIKNRWINELELPFQLSDKFGISGPLKLFDTNTNYEFIVFFCACIRRELFDKIGMLDAGFGVGSSEDIDFCIRAIKSGYLIAETPINGERGSFPIHHKGEETVSTLDNWDGIYQKNLELLKEKHPKIKLNLGCGNMILEGYVNIDLYNEKADMKCDISKLPFDDNSVDEVYSSHVIEHFDFMAAFDVFSEWKRVLKHGGMIILETIDMVASCKKFVESNEQERINLYSHFFSEPWIPGQIHKFLYTSVQMRWTLEQLGFKDIHQVRANRYIGKEDINMCFIGVK